jgi:uncharacterized protein YbaP (TraB family)
MTILVQGAPVAGNALRQRQFPPMPRAMSPLRLLLLLAAILFAGLPARPVQADADPALWVVRDADTTVYLFGTVHVLRPGLGWFDEAVRDTFDASDVLVLELVAPSAEAMGKLAAEFGASPVPLSRRIGAREEARVEAALADLGMPPRSLEGHDPWFAATLLSVQTLNRLGYATAEGAEAVLADAAARAGKSVTGLETAREQFAILDGLSDASQRALLDATLDGLPETRRTIERTVAAWSRGDTSALAALADAELRAAPEIRARMLSERNARWAEWIAARMHRPGTVFVAVGTGHLAGADSVQAELAKRGLKAERVSD